MMISMNNNQHVTKKVFQQVIFVMISHMKIISHEIINKSAFDMSHSEPHGLARTIARKRSSPC